MSTIELRLGDSFDLIPTLQDVDAVVCDPPYLISFMGIAWDKKDNNLEWFSEWLQKCFDILPQGGVIKVFSATRTFHRLAQAMERVGFGPIGLEAWAYGCLSEDTEIWTTSGWASGPSIAKGDKVTCWNPRNGKTEIGEVQQVTLSPYKGDMIRIHSKKTDQLVTPNHRVYMKTFLKGLRVMEAWDLVGQRFRVPIKNRWGIGYTMPSVTTEHYAGNVWCVKVPTGAFIARRKGNIFITGNSGFPKSHNISKAIDKIQGVDDDFTNGEHPSRAFDGWGTALKPAWEPFLVGVKP